MFIWQEKLVDAMRGRLLPRNRRIARVLEIAAAFGAVLLMLTLAAPAAAAASVPRVVVGPVLGNLSATFWGANYDWSIGSYANHTVASYVNETPFRFLRLPLPYAPLNKIYPAAYTFCRWVHCQSEITVGGPTVSPLAAAQAVRDLIDNYSINATYWAYGNEPNLWHPNHHRVNGTEYALLVRQFIADVRAFDPGAQFVGLEMAGQPLKLDPYLYNVTKIDGANISVVGLHDYSQEGGTVGNLLDDFMRGLFGVASVGEAVQNAENVIASACRTCNIKVAVHEVNDGNGAMKVYNPYRQGYADEVFYAASVVEAFDSHAFQFLPWTLTAVESYRCDIGLIELDHECNGIARTLNPGFYFFSQLAGMLPIGGQIVKVSLPHHVYTFLAKVTKGHTSRLLAVNADPIASADFSLAPLFPGGSQSLKGYLVTNDTYENPVGTTFASDDVVLPPLSIAVLDL
jgi:hypothetical protein